ncbi:hypothetical protein KAR48_15520 [bacterium]|nr:hypothetical protein [bacterium]
MKFRLSIFAALLIAFLVSACDMLSPEPYKPAMININFESPGSLSKAAAIEKVWVIVADYNPFVWDETDYDPDNYEEQEYREAPDTYLYNIFNKWDDIRQRSIIDSIAVYNLGLDRHEGWLQFLSKHSLTPVSDQYISVVQDTARGSVLAVPGSNWVIIGFEEAGVVVQYYESVVIASKDTVTDMTVLLDNIHDIPRRD